jgi:hypothetical protein
MMEISAIFIQTCLCGFLEERRREKNRRGGEEERRRDDNII